MFVMCLKMFSVCCVSVAFQGHCQKFVFFLGGYKIFWEGIKLNSMFNSHSDVIFTP